MGNTANQEAKKHKLQAVFTAIVVVPFLAQIALAAGLTGWLFLRSGQQTTAEVTSRLRDEIAQRIRDRLDNYLAVPHRINQANAEAVRLGLLDLDQVRTLELQFWRQIQLHDSLSSIGFGRADGVYVAGDRRGSQFRLGRKDANSPAGALRMYETDRQGNPTRLVYTGKPNYDPRQRPWYQLGKTAPQGRWTTVFTYSAQPIPVISAVRAVLDQTGQVRGVLITDLILSDISEFLQQLPVGKTGQTFILERSGQLVASSVAEQPFRVVGNKVERLQASDSQSPLIRATADYLRHQFQAFEQIQRSYQLDFVLEGQRQFLQVLPYVDDRGLDWLIVVVVPESDFMAHLQATTRTTILLGLVALLLGLLLGLLTTRWLVRPIARLSAAATALANGNWDHTVPIEREDELGVLAAAFNRMAAQLKTSLATLEQREANLSEAQRVAHVGSWEYHLTAKTGNWSDELVRIYGLDPGTVTSSYVDLMHRVHPEDIDGLQQAIEQGIRLARPFEVDYRIQLPACQTRFVHAKGQPTLDASGQVIRLFGTVLDITARKQAELERDQLLKRERVARAEAESANQVKDQFLAILSHELRTPLNPILGWTQLLRLQKLDEARTAKALETIERNVKLQTQLIDDLLDISRILQGKLSLNPQAVDLAAVVLAAIETVRLAAEAKAIQLTPRLELAPTWVWGDPNRLQQVVWNLLSNAIKFTPEGGRVEIQLQQIPASAPDAGDKSAPPQVQIAIRDTGQGIAPELFPHLFDYFWQADSTTTRSSGGLGLGLAIVHHLVESHGGTVAVASPGSNQGSTFTVTLPLLLNAPPESAAADSSPVTPRLEGIQILIVDDEVDNLAFLGAFLETAGAIVQAVTSGEAALQAIAAQPPAVLISDISMPQMDGYRLLEQVRKLPAEQGGNVVAIALTALAGESNQQRILAAGFQAHLSKPSEPAQLVAAIADLLRRSVC